MLVELNTRTLLKFVRVLAHQKYPGLKLSKVPSKACEVAKLLLKQQYPNLKKKNIKTFFGAESNTFMWQGVLLNFVQNNGKICKPIKPLKLSKPYCKAFIPLDVCRLVDGFADIEMEGNVKREHVDTYSPEKAKKLYLSKEWRELRYDVLREQDGRCQLCGRGRKDGVILHVDHIVPLSKDWSKRLDKNNLQVLCEDCNLGKSNTDQIDWR